MSSRRNFIQNTATMVGGSLLLSSLDNNAFALFKNKVAPSDRMYIGVIGIKGMGWSKSLWRRVRCVGFDISAINSGGYCPLLFVRINAIVEILTLKSGVIVIFV